MASEFLKISTKLQARLIRELFERKPLMELLEKITAEVGAESEVLEADACSIYLVEEGGTGGRPGKARMRGASGYQKDYINVAEARILDPDRVPEEPEDHERLGVTGWVLSTGRAFLARTSEELEAHPHWSGKFDQAQLPVSKKVSTFLAVPFRNLAGQVIGLFKAERLGSGKPFSIEDQLMLETLARVAGRCIVYEKEARHASIDTAITFWAREVIAEAVAAEGELDSFLDMVAKVIASATRADSCAIFHIDQERRTLTQRAGSGAQALRSVVRSYEIPDREKVIDCINTRICRPDTCQHRNEIPPEDQVGLTAWMAATGKSFHASNRAELEKHCHHRGQFDQFNYDLDRKEDCGAWLGVPLRVGGSTIGVLKVENVSITGEKDTRDFYKEDWRRLDLLAQEVALAIERLQLQYRARYQVIDRAMPTILEILRGELDVEPLVKRVVEETAKLFEARACALFLKEGNDLIQRAAVGWASLGQPHGPPRTYQLVSADQITEENKVGLTVWLAVTGKMFTAKSYLELLAHPHHRGKYDDDNFVEGEQCESFMGIPLMAGQELVGVLKVETKMRRVGEEEEFAYFSELDELAFTLIANSAAIAIQNARLLESRRLAERILAVPNAMEVLRELHHFVEGRGDVINTLWNTAEVLSNKDKVKALIVTSFTGLLDPDFDSYILQKLVDNVEGPIKELLMGVSSGIQARNLDEIRVLQKKFEWVEILSPKLFLFHCASRLSNDLREVTKKLDTYDRDPWHRASLQESKEHLKTAIDQIHDFNVFERFILGRQYRQWLEVIEEALKKFQKVRNPYLAGPPLVADSPVFVGREKTFRWIEEKLTPEGQKNSLFLHGGWHTGKTSILKQLEAGSQGKRFRRGSAFRLFPVYVDFQGIDFEKGAKGVFEYIAKAISRKLKGLDIPCPVPERQEFLESHTSAFDKCLESVDNLPDYGRLVLMLDEFDLLFEKVEQGEIDPTIFNYFRTLIQHRERISMILAARHSLDMLDTVDKTKLFNVAHHREIGFLGTDEVIKLIQRPVMESGVTYEKSVVRDIRWLTGGHPFLIQQLCEYCIDLLNERESGFRVGQEHLDYAVEHALQPGNVATLEDLWREVKESAQIVLKILADLSREDQQWISSSKLLAEARKTGLDEKAFADSIRRLTTFRLIEQDKSSISNEHRYKYSADLMRVWVQRRP